MINAILFRANGYVFDPLRVCCKRNLESNLFSSNNGFHSLFFILVSLIRRLIFFFSLFLSGSRLIVVSFVFTCERCFLHLGHVFPFFFLSTLLHYLFFFFLILLSSFQFRLDSFFYCLVFNLLLPFPSFLIYQSSKRANDPLVSVFILCNFSIYLSSFFFNLSLSSDIISSFPLQPHFRFLFSSFFPAFFFFPSFNFLKSPFFLVSASLLLFLYLTFLYFLTFLFFHLLLFSLFLFPFILLSPSLETFFSFLSIYSTILSFLVIHQLIHTYPTKPRNTSSEKRFSELTELHPKTTSVVREQTGGKKIIGRPRNAVCSRFHVLIIFQGDIKKKKKKKKQK